MSFLLNDSLTISSSNELILKNETNPFDLSNRSDGIILPVGTMSERPQLPSIGMMRFNSTIIRPEIYTFDGWKRLDTDYNTLEDITPRSLPHSYDIATITGRDFVPGMIFEFVGSSGVSHIVPSWSFVNLNTVQARRPSIMPPEEEPYTLCVTMPNGSQYELLDIVEVGDSPIILSPPAGALGTFSSGCNITPIAITAFDSDGSNIVSMTKTYDLSQLNFVYNNNNVAMLSGTTTDIIQSTTTYNFTVTAMDSGSNVASRNYNITVLYTPLAITSSLPANISHNSMNNSYSTSYTFTANKAGVTWSLTPSSAFATINSLTGVMSVNFDQGAIGSGLFTVTASWGIDSTSQSWSYQVYSYDVTANPVRSYPSAPLLSNVHTVSGSAYGNGLHTCAESSYEATSLGAFRMFDKNNGYERFWMSANRYTQQGAYIGSSDTLVGSSTISGEWAQIHLPQPIALKSYSLAGRYAEDSNGIYGRERRSPRTWFLAGSTNGTSWTLIDANSQAAWNEDAPKVVVLPSTAPEYSYFRVIVTQVGQASLSDCTHATISELILDGHSNTVIPSNYTIYIDYTTSPSYFINDASTLPTFDVANQRIIFNRTSKYFDVGPRTYNMLTNGWTFLINLTLTANNNSVDRIFDSGAENNNYITFLLSSGNALRFLIRNSSNVTLCDTTTSQTLALNTTYVLAARTTSQHASIWINGVKVKEVSCVPTDRTNNNSRIGVDPYISSAQLSAYVYNVYVYNYALSDTDIGNFTS